MGRGAGYRRKTRYLLRKHRIRGLSYLLHEYNIGDKVVIDIDPTEHKSMPHRRFQGKVGVIEEIGRRVMKVRLRSGDKEKVVIARFNHFKPL